MNDPLLGLQIVATMAMTGVIWYVQVVHYPLFDMVDRDRFPEFERRHSAATGRVVAPLMIIEAVTALILLVDPPDGFPQTIAILGMVLIAIIWLSTFRLQVPCHRRLERGFDPVVHRRLVRTNWIRTVAWTARATLFLWVLSS